MNLVIVNDISSQTVAEIEVDISGDNEERED